MFLSRTVAKPQYPSARTNHSSRNIWAHQCGTPWCKKMQLFCTFLPLPQAHSSPHIVGCGSYTALPLPPEGVAPLSWINKFSCSISRKLALVGWHCWQMETFQGTGPQMITISLVLPDGCAGGNLFRADFSLLPNPEHTSNPYGKQSREVSVRQSGDEKYKLFIRFNY